MFCICCDTRLIVTDVGELVKAIQSLLMRITVQLSATRMHRDLNTLRSGTRNVTC